jgi:hypothetical protein
VTTDHESARGQMTEQTISTAAAQKPTLPQGPMHVCMCTVELSTSYNSAAAHNGTDPSSSSSSTGAGSSRTHLSFQDRCPEGRGAQHWQSRCCWQELEDWLVVLPARELRVRRQLKGGLLLQGGGLGL